MFYDCFSYEECLANVCSASVKAKKKKRFGCFIFEILLLFHLHFEYQWGTLGGEGEITSIFLNVAQPASLDAVAA